MKPLLYLIVFLTTVGVSAQTINGVVYDSIATVSAIKIENLANKQMTLSDSTGQFYIVGQVNDTLSFSSIFYENQKVVIKTIHSTEPLVIELKAVVNNLDEVKLVTAYKEQLRTIETAQATLGNQLANDKKNNPHLYGQLNNKGLDIIEIIGLIGKLFKNKNKATPVVVATYKDFKQLFETSKLFNNKLLKDTLNIPEDNTNLFFQYIEAKQLDSELLKEAKAIYLLDILIKSGAEFNLLFQ